jgi:DNA-binding IclR family transcriptional regulator
MDDKVSSPAARSQRRIQSIDVGFRLIRVLERASGKLPLSVIAERAEMPASKAHLYMVSFTQIGLIEQDPVSMRYGLGPYALQLGAAALRQLDVVQVAGKGMDELQAATGLLVFLSVWGNRGPVIISKVDSTIEMPFSMRVGYVLPLYRSATGQVFLAHKPRAAIEHVLAGEQPVEAAIRDRVEKGLADIRESGVAFSDNQLNMGAASISAPIFDFSGEISAAVTLLGMSNDLQLDTAGKAASQVRSIAEQISQQLAYRS